MNIWIANGLRLECLFYVEEIVYISEAAKIIRDPGDFERFSSGDFVLAVVKAYPG